MYSARPWVLPVPRAPEVSWCGSPRLDGNDKKLVVLDVGDPVTIRGKLRVERGCTAAFDDFAQRRLRAVQHKQAAGQRHQHPLAVLSPGVLGHPQLALAQALTAQLFFQRKVLFADAANRRGKQQPLLTRLDVVRVQLASEATFRTEQKGQQAVV